jgi:hypothetical protein
VQQVQGSSFGRCALSLVCPDPAGIGAGADRDCGFPAGGLRGGGRTSTRPVGAAIRTEPECGSVSTRMAPRHRLAIVAGAQETGRQ